MEDILWTEEIVKNASIIPFFSKCNVNTVGFIYSYKFVLRRNMFLAFASAQNENVSKVRTRSFGHGRLKV
jgi:hypothetical protein